MESSDSTFLAFRFLEKVVGRPARVMTLRACPRFIVLMVVVVVMAVMVLFGLWVGVVADPQLYYNVPHIAITISPQRYKSTGVLYKP